MDKNAFTPKYIIVLGTTYSGSGAIFDYLSERGDLYNPLLGEEYELPQITNGLLALEAACNKAFDPATCEYAIFQFEKITNRLINRWSKQILGKNFPDRLKLFKEEFEKFINEVTATDFPMKLNWRQYTQTPLQKIINIAKRRVGFIDIIPKTRILVSEDKFVFSAQKLHDRIFLPESAGSSILLNQAGSGWNAIESTKYFSSSKVVIVTRDPRDQYLGIKQFKKANSVRGFVNWYKEMQLRLKKIEDPKILKISFENFVNKYENSVEKLCKHINLPPNKSSNYQPNLSKKNIGKFSQLLSKSEIDIIETELSDYIY